MLDLLAHSPKALTLSAIAKQLDIPKSSALDIIQTLQQRELIELSNPELKTYKLGINLFTLGATVINQNSLHSVARSLLTKLSHETKKTLYLGVPKQGNIVYVVKAEGGSPVRFSRSVGDTNPMYLTGIGKAILATLPDEDVRELYGDGPYEKRTAQSLTSYPMLVENLKQTRSQGYAIDDREGVDYIYCFAAPVYDYTGKAIAAISIVSLASEIGEEEQRTYPSLVINTALNMSRQMGFSKQQLYI